MSLPPVSPPLTNTATLQLPLNGSSSVRFVPQLFCVLEAGRPLAAASRHTLDDLDEVKLVRGNPRAHKRDQRVLTITIPDRWLSSVHAGITRTDVGYVFSDLQSKNGSKLNGAPVKSAILKDADIIEIGQTFFIYRERAALLDVDVSDFSISAEQTIVGLATLHSTLNAQFSDLARIAMSEVPVTILGETGTGKELVARAVHEMSRRGGMFVAVNCGAIPKDLAPSAFFGHTKGAFSGASADKVGLIRSAEAGTLFLDEIGDLPLDQQVVLLRVLQERSVQPVGAVAARKVDFRLVVATHRDIAAAVVTAQFREDLWARVSGFVLRLPPLRERLEDLGLILGALLSRERGRGASKITIRSDAAYALLRHGWPRNIRELEQCMRAALALGRGDIITPAELPEWIRGPFGPPPGADLSSVRNGDPAEQPGAGNGDPAEQPGAGNRDSAEQLGAGNGDPAEQPGADHGDPAEQPGADHGDPAEHLDELRQAHLQKLLEQHHGNISEVARVMGKARNQIQRWIKRYRIDIERYRRP